MLLFEIFVCAARIHPGQNRQSILVRGSAQITE
jgi:hypothetical protein